MAHEIGHALGMPHDFINEKPRFDSKGQNCTAMNGIMSYEVRQFHSNLLPKGYILNEKN